MLNKLAGESVSRRRFINYGVTAVVAGVVAGVGGYYAGVASVPPPSAPTTVTVTATGPAPPTTVAPPPKREKVRIGRCISRSGALAGICVHQDRAIWLWEEQCNAKGGLNVGGQKLPVEEIVYDDRSSLDEAMKFYERLITVDKVDLLMFNYGTFMAAGLQPLMDKYKMPFVCTTSMPLPDVPTKYEFFVAPSSESHGVAMAELLSSVGAKTVGLLVIETLFGADMRKYFEAELAKKAINIVATHLYPMGVMDLSAPLLDLRAKNPDAVIQLSYPDDALLCTQQMIEINYNPKLFYSALGLLNADFTGKFGKAREGICCFGQSFVPAAKHQGVYGNARDWYEAYVKRWGAFPDYTESLNPYTGCEVLQQAVEKAGTLDGTAIRDVLARETFDTVAGPVKFGGPNGAINISDISGVGTTVQWQKQPDPITGDEFTAHVVSPSRLATAKVIYPKPPWPK